MITIVDGPIDTTAVLQSVSHHDAGANLLFVGTTREFTAGQQTVRLEYDAYGAMALKQMEAIAAQAGEKWDLQSCSIVHRVGVVELGEASIALAVSAAHRDTAFAAGRWLIDELKVVVPIWKKECWANGTTEWVHPTRPS